MNCFALLVVGFSALAAEPATFVPAELTKLYSVPMDIMLGRLPRCELSQDGRYVVFLFKVKRSIHVVDVATGRQTGEFVVGRDDDHPRSMELGHLAVSTDGRTVLLQRGGIEVYKQCESNWKQVYVNRNPKAQEYWGYRYTANLDSLFFLDVNKAGKSILRLVHLNCDADTRPLSTEIVLKEERRDHFCYAGCRERLAYLTAPNSRSSATDLVEIDVTDGRELRRTPLGDSELGLSPFQTLSFRGDVVLRYRLGHHSSNGPYQIYHLAERRTLRFDDSISFGGHMLLSPNGNFVTALVPAGESWIPTVYDTGDLKPIAQLKNAPGAANRFTADGRSIIILTRDGVIYRWDFLKKQPGA